MNAMRVIHISSAHPYTDNRIHYRECVSLAAVGYDVSLIAVEAAVRGETTSVNVLTIPRRKRLARISLGALQAVRYALKSRAGIVHLHDPELVPYIPLLKLAGRQVVYDAHEDLPVQVQNKSYLRGWQRFGAVQAAKFIVLIARRADLIVAATPTIAARFDQRATVVVRNFPPIEDERASPIAQRKNQAVYVGAQSKGRGTADLLTAARDPQFPEDWSLHLAGASPPDLRAEIAEAVSQADVVHHGLIAPSTVRELLGRSKVGIVTLRDTPAYRDALPTKMFEYFAAGLPVVASDFPLWRGILQEAQCGIVVDPRDPEAIAAAVRRYAEDPALWRAHAENARRAAISKYNWFAESEVLVAAYNGLSRL